MKLGFSLNVFKKHSLKDALRIVSDIGYQGVEVMADVPHVHPMEAGPAQAEEIRGWLDELSLTVSNVNAFTMMYEGDTWHPSWLEPDAAARARRVLHTVRSMRFAERIGAASITTEPGGPVPQGMPFDEALALFIAGLEETLLQTPESVRILVEPEPNLLLENSREFDAFAERFEHARVGFNFDVGHFFCAGEDIPALIRRYAGRIGHVHIEDIAASREHYHLVPGDGSIDFDSVFEALEDAGYDGWVSVELYPFVDRAAHVAERAFAALRGYFE